MGANRVCGDARGRLRGAQAAWALSVLVCGAALAGEANFVFRYDLTAKRLEYRMSLVVRAGPHAQSLEDISSVAWTAFFEPAPDGKIRVTASDARYGTVGREAQHLPDCSVVLSMDSSGRIEAGESPRYVGPEGQEMDTKSRLAAHLPAVSAALVIPALCRSDIPRPPGSAWIVEARRWALQGEGDRFPFPTLMVERIRDDAGDRIAEFRGLRLDEVTDPEQFPKVTRDLGVPINRTLWEGRFEFSMAQRVVKRAEVIRGESMVGPLVHPEADRVAFQETRWKAELVKVERVASEAETPAPGAPGPAER